MDPEQAQCYVGPDLDPNCLQRLSAEDTIVGKELMNFLRYDHLTTMCSKLAITDPEQAQCNVWPDLDPNCLQRLSAEDTIVGKELMNFLRYDHLTTVLKVSYHRPRTGPMLCRA